VIGQHGVLRVLPIEQHLLTSRERATIVSDADYAARKVRPESETALSFFGVALAPGTGGEASLTAHR
jgi:hypothetical protein